MSNHTTYDHPAVKPILLGDNIDYSTNLLNALEQVPQSYIIVWIEDMIMCRKQPGEIEEVIDRAVEENISYLRLWKTAT